jgi:hypothetical protein
MAAKQGGLNYDTTRPPSHALLMVGLDGWDIPTSPLSKLELFVEILQMRELQATRPHLVLLDSSKNIRRAPPTSCRVGIRQVRSPWSRDATVYITSIIRVAKAPPDWIPGHFREFPANYKAPLLGASALLKLHLPFDSGTAT